jgi:hypothetical protein
MWCKNCRQDVRGIRSDDQPGVRCARCDALLSADAAPSAAHAASLAATAEHGVDLGGLQSPLSPYPSFEDWEIEQNFRQLQARAGPWGNAQRPAPATRPSGNRQPNWHVHARHPTLARPHHRESRPGRRARAAKAVVLVGVVACSIGAALITWSFIEHRPDAWDRGLSVVIAGQVVLLLGLALQLERVWQNSRYAARKLQRVDSQLDRLERTTTLMSVTHSSAAQAFYAHMADEASPHLLLADLKGQLDLLARSVAKRAR